VVGEAAVVVDVVDVVGVPGGHTVETPNTFNPAGTNDAIGVPTGTLNTSPPLTTTRTTQPEATPTPGSPAPRPTTAAPAVASPTRSFRLLNTLACLLPPSCMLIASGRDRKAACRGRYWLGAGFAMRNRGFAGWFGACALPNGRNFESWGPKSYPLRPKLTV
jgi:hypothetical protein